MSEQGSEKSSLRAMLVGLAVLASVCVGLALYSEMQKGTISDLKEDLRDVRLR